MSALLKDGPGLISPSIPKVYHLTINPADRNDLEIRRISSAVEANIHASLVPFIGQRNTIGTRNALQQVIATTLNDMVSRDVISQYEVPTVTVDSNGNMLLQYEVTPAFALRRISTTIQIQSEENV